MTELVEKSLSRASELLSEGIVHDAELICRQILKIDDGNPDAMLLLSCCLVRSGDQESEQLIAKVKNMSGEGPGLHNSLGISYMHAKDIDKALSHFSKASELDPLDEDSRFNTASCFMMLGDFKNSLRFFREAYSVSKSSRSMIGMACSKSEMLDFDGAIELLRMVLESDPKNHQARTDMASILHLAGRWDEAWSYYPSRLNHYERLRKTVEAIGLPVWTEGEPPKGRILVFSEQGVGDAINFGRMSSVFQQKYPDRDVVVFVNPQLRRLIGSQGVKTASGTEGFDACCSMIDLPGLLRMTKEEVRESFAPMVTDRSCDMSAFIGIFKVGVCWAGNPAHPKDYERSFALDNFRDICLMEGVKLFSLQRENRPRVWPTSKEPVDLSKGDGMRLVDMSKYMNSWEDTAAIVSAMDLVISADTSVLHLSASLGKETWGVIPFMPDWRWGMSSEDCCWYPNLKLFRQESRGDWKGVFSAIRDELGRKLRG